MLQPANIQQKQAPFEAPAPATATSPKRRLIIPLLIGGGLLTVICSCAALCGLVFGGSVLGVATQRSDVATVIDAFMQAMSNKDTDQAYTLFSNRARRQMPLSKMQEMLKGPNFALFDGYEKVEVTYLNIGPAFSTSPNVPQVPLRKLVAALPTKMGTPDSFKLFLNKKTKNGRYTIST